VVINYTKQILKGLEYLHSHEVIHRDLKAANVLVDRNGECKLADFGTAKSVHELNGQNNTLTGTLNWMAPEVIQQQAYGRAADIWSIGCTVYEMVNGMPPWHEAGNIVSIVQQYQVMSKVVNSEETPIFTQSVSALCKDFIACCLKRKPEDRLNVYKLLRHPFLSSKSRKDPVAMFFEADSPILPPEGDEIQSETSGLQGSDLRRAKTSRPSKLDFKQTTFRHRQAGLKQPSGKSNQQEGSKKDSKDFSLPTPCVMDSQGNQRHFFGSPYVEPNRQKRSSGSGQESFSEKIQKFNSRFGDGHDQSTLKSGTKQKPLTSRQLRIPLSKQGNITLESNNQENSRNLAINIKKKGLTLNVKTDTALGNTKIVNKGKGFHVEQPVDEVSDFDFDVHDEPEAEVIHEYKITIHEKRKLLRPLTRKPLKSQRQIATDKTSQSIYEAREADLLNNTPLREVFEVPNLVLGPVESETSRDLRSAFMPLRSPLPKTNRPTITPSDFLALSVEPGQDVNK
jgi:serine/threonine protein kinase